MHVYVLFCLLFISVYVKAQPDKKLTGPFKTRKGLELNEGDTLRLGRGTTIDGSFQYIKTGFVLTSATNDPLPATHANALVTIRFFRQVKIGQGNKVMVSLKAGTLMPAYTDIEAAIDAKEIVAVNGHEIGKPRPKQQNVVDHTLTASIKNSSANSAVQEGMTVKQFSNDVDIKILSIVGNKSQQTVTVNFVLRTELPHQQVRLLWYGCGTNRGEGKAYDGDGTEYNMKNVSLGNVLNTGSAENKLPTSVPLKGSITFTNVLPKVSTLSFVTFFVSSKNYEGGEHCQEGNVEIRNAKIDWK